MLLINSTWNTGKTFRLISTSKDCPYNEAIYDREQGVLAVISKEMKETYQMVPKFTDKGDVQYLKQARANGKEYAEERRALQTWVEYYIEDKEDIITLVNHFAMNADIFDYARYFEKPEKPATIENIEMYPGPTKV